MNLWDGITEFVAVADTGSFTAAARKLDTSTAQLSRKVSALEKRVETKLFYRTTRKVTLTEAGQLYYEHCRQLVDGLQEAQQALTNLQQSPRGTLKLTLPVTYGEQKIAPLLLDFMQQYPELSVECQMTNQQVDLIESGFDLAIRLGKLEDSSLVARQLTSRQLYVCASPDYLTTHGAPEHLSDLDLHNCLPGTLGYWRFQDNGEERNIRVSGSMRCNSGQVLLEAALKGFGLVQLPDYYVEQYLEQGLLIPVLEPYQSAGEGVWAVFPQNRYLSPKIRLLVDFLSDALSR